MSKFQRRHYRVIARALAEARLGTERDDEQWHLIVEAIAAALSADSPSFHVALFEQACREGSRSCPSTS